ncbi:hypothetical protein ACTXT7_005467 [Hymenolepis weldensis]
MEEVLKNFLLGYKSTPHSALGERFPVEVLMGLKLRKAHEAMPPKETLPDRKRGSKKNGFAVNTPISGYRSGCGSAAYSSNKMETFSSPGQSVLKDLRDLMADNNITTEKKKHAVIVSIKAKHSNLEIASFLRVTTSLVCKIRKEVNENNADELAATSKRRQDCQRSTDSLRTPEFVKILGSQCNSLPKTFKCLKE